ncbi:recombinase family protein [Cohnella ginsengisoli]|uniref:Recombinase family protein n=1 Tax=Cohnella ginsengisoli TaxID=425004 RepID=A0A9X4KGR2_9BACL|nr:recombinase family protein [Cohnella ginsengisoli]MDG0791969.1 recombinase family protein [Cohnella ginsengisoli]
MKPSDMPIRVAIYTRVSTLDQVEGYSLDNQRERLMAFCAAQGWNDVTVYMDDGESGTNMERPGLKRMIRHIEEKKINAVVVLKLDRLSRRQKDVLYLLEEVFESNGVIFKSATEPFDTSTPLGKAMIGVLAVFAQLERDMIIERTSTGRRQRISSGKWGGGNVAYGYSFNKELEKLEIVEEEALVIREIFSRYIKGESRESIAMWASKRTSRFIDNTIVKNILSRPTYAGKLQHGDELFEGNHDPIVTTDEWQAAQTEMKRRRDGLSPKGAYLLTGLLRCGLCGGPIIQSNITRKKPNKIYEYDFCACAAQQIKRRTKDGHVKCTLGFHRRHEVEKFVIDRIKGIDDTDQLTRDKINKQSQGSNDHVRKALESRIKTIEGEINNLLDAIQAGLKASTVTGRIAKLEREKDALDQQLDDIKDTEKPVVVDYEEIKRVGEMWDYLTEDEQKTILRRVILQVVLHPKGTDHEIIWNV